MKSRKLLPAVLRRTSDPVAIVPGSVSVKSPNDFLCNARIKTSIGLEIRAAGKLQKGQTHASDKYGVSADRRRRRKPVASGSGNKVVLIDAVATDANRADKGTVLIQRYAAGEDLQSVCNIRNFCLRDGAATESCD